MTTTSAESLATGRVARSNAFRPDIQGLRAVAVAAVIADHIIGWPHGGFVGVDVFFVISGYLITGLLMREFERTGSVSFTGFYRRRIKRIMPVAFMVLFVTLCASYVLFQGRFREISEDALASLLFLGNWQFARIGTDYFQQDMPPSPMQHYWSLAVEEQFYLVWPWLLLGLLLFGVKYLRWRREHARTVAGIVVGVIALGSFAWSMHETSTNVAWAYFSTVSRTWELGLGALVAVAAPWLRIRAARVRTALAWSGLAGIALATLVTPAGHGFPAPWAALPVVATAAVIAAGEGGPTWAPLITNRVSRYLGEISYSLYLWHWPVAMLLVAVVPRDMWGYVPIALGLTLVLSAASYRWLEQPARTSEWLRWKKQPRKRRHPVGVASGWYRLLAAAGVVLLVTAAAEFGYRVGAPERQVVPEAAIVAPGSSDPADCIGAAALDPRHGCTGLNSGGAVAPLPREVLRDVHGRKCFMDNNTRWISCEMGSKAQDVVRVALVGDSHANQQIAALEPHLGELNWQLTTFLGWDCAWHLPGLEVKQDVRNCRERLPRIHETVTSGQYDLILAVTRRGEGVTVAEHAAVLKDAVARGIRVVVIADNPDPSNDAVECVLRYTFDVADRCGTSRSMALAEPDRLVEAARAVDGVGVVDLSELYCVDGFCPSVVGNVIVYRDASGHTTATWQRTLSPYLMDAIQEAARLPGG